MEKYERMLKRKAKEFVITSEDLSNLTDLFYMINDDTCQTLKINNMQKWFHKFQEKVERITIPEIYNKK